MKLVKENIRVVAYFSSEGVVPICFEYNNRKYKIAKINKSWEERRNLHCCIFYICQDQDSLIELKWDRDNNKWYLEKI